MGLHCFPRPFWQVTSVQMLEHLLLLMEFHEGEREIDPKCGRLTDDPELSHVSIYRNYKNFTQVNMRLTLNVGG